MVDQYVTEGRTLFMSRWAVAYVFPLFMIPMWIVRAVLIFKRGAVANKVVRCVMYVCRSLVLC